MSAAVKRGGPADARRGGFERPPAPRVIVGESPRTGLHEDHMESPRVVSYTPSRSHLIMSSAARFQFGSSMLSWAVSGWMTGSTPYSLLEFVEADAAAQGVKLAGAVAGQQERIRGAGRRRASRDFSPAPDWPGRMDLALETDTGRSRPAVAGPPDLPSVRRARRSGCVPAEPCPPTRSHSLRAPTGRPDDTKPMEARLFRH